MQARPPQPVPPLPGMRSCPSLENAGPPRTRPERLPACRSVGLPSQRLRCREETRMGVVLGPIGCCHRCSQARHPLTFALSAGVTTGAQVITTPSRTRIAFSIIVSHTDRRRKTILIAQDILTTSSTAQALSSTIPAVPNIPAKTEALSACGWRDGWDGRPRRWQNTACSSCAPR